MSGIVGLSETSLPLLPLWGPDVGMWVLRLPRGLCTHKWPQATCKSHLTNLGSTTPLQNNSPCRGEPHSLYLLLSVSRYRL